MTHRFKNFKSFHLPFHAGWHWWVACLILFSTELIIMTGIHAEPQGDVELYKSVANDLSAGKLPYRDRVLEYPPYFIPVTVAPKALEGLDIPYETAFNLLSVLLDWSLKLVLFYVCLKRAGATRLLLIVSVYCLSICCLKSFYLQRYDLWPALVCLLGVLGFFRQRFFLAGVLLAAGVGLKVYPIFFLLPLAMIAAKADKFWRFTGGILAGLAPLLLLGFMLPWWRFAAFHAARGLQCESLYASLIWLAHYLVGITAEWNWYKSWFEVQGPVAAAVLPWSRLLLLAAVIFSTGIAAAAAAVRENASLAPVSRILLIPLLAFIAFNQVLSPQYLIWILPLAALGLMADRMTPCLLLFIATILTPIIYPSFTNNYATGLNPIETAVLVTRNYLLVLAWWWLVLDELRGIRPQGLRPLRAVVQSIFSSGRKQTEAAPDLPV